MAIEVSSAGWTGDAASAPQVCGEFQDAETLQTALSKLEGSLFQRADLTVRNRDQEGGAPVGGGEGEAVREDDTRNLRQLGVGVGAYVAGAAAAGLVLATGGAALPAVAAAAAASGGAAVVGEGVGQAAAPGGESAGSRSAEGAGVVLAVIADTAEKQGRAEALLQENGAIRVWRENC